jgi:hypothetical protein
MNRPDPASSCVAGITLFRPRRRNSPELCSPEHKIVLVRDRSKRSWQKLLNWLCLPWVL